MWFDPAQLLKNAHRPLATSATLRLCQPDKAESAPKVAGIAKVAAIQELKNDKTRIIEPTLEPGLWFDDLLALDDVVDHGAGYKQPEWPVIVRCADCGHAQKTDHAVLIHCGAGREAPGACGMWWGLDMHSCASFTAR